MTMLVLHMELVGLFQRWLNHQPVVFFPHIGGQFISVHLPLVQPNGMA
jgi:hypothetical protein